MNSTSRGEETAPNHRHSADQTCIYRAYSDDRGHYLHVSINRNGKLFQKYFPDKRCGDEQNTMKLAQAWRDNIIAKYPPMSLMAFCSILRSNNTSGVAGISRTVKRNRAKSGGVAETAYWKSCIPMADGKARLCYFSVIKFGEEGAKLLAIEARMLGLSALENIAFREKQQPLSVSTLDDIALLEASLRAPAERRARQIAERAAKREQIAQRDANKLALSLAAEEEALDRAAKRTANCTSAGTQHQRAPVFTGGSVFIVKGHTIVSPSPIQSMAAPRRPYWLPKPGVTNFFASCPSPAKRCSWRASKRPTPAVWRA